MLVSAIAFTHRSTLTMFEMHGVFLFMEADIDTRVQQMTNDGIAGSERI